MLFLNEVDNFLNGLQQPEIGIFFFIQIAWMLLAVFCVQEMRSELERHFGMQLFMHQSTWKLVIHPISEILLY